MKILRSLIKLGHLNKILHLRCNTFFRALSLFLSPFSSPTHAHTRQPAVMNLIKLQGRIHRIRMQFSPSPPRCICICVCVLEEEYLCEKSHNKYKQRNTRNTIRLPQMIIIIIIIIASALLSPASASASASASLNSHVKSSNKTTTNVNRRRFLLWPPCSH